MIGNAFKPAGNKKTLILSSIGTVIGLCLLLIAVQVYTDINFAIKNNNNDQYLVIKKQITTLNTVGLTSSDFTKDDIQDLKEQSFVSDLAPFKSGNGVEVMAIMSITGGNFPPFSTLAFFESIPDQFIDVETKEWEWKEGNNEIPIILPNTFLDAYNYGIAPSMGAPQASKSLIGSIKFTLKVSGKKGSTVFYGRVVNFSDRVNSILVPEDFLSYLNHNYGSDKITKPSRVIISTPNKSNPAIKDYLNQNNYETNEDQLKENIIQQITSNLFYFLLSIGLIIIFLAALLFILYSQIIINKSEKEIRTLLLLGYKWQAITKTIISLFVKIYGIVTLISFLILLVFKFIFDEWLANKIDLILPNFIAIITFVVGLAFILLFLLINYISISKAIKNIAVPK